jgi:hypothetical protein
MKSIHAISLGAKMKAICGLSFIVFLMSMSLAAEESKKAETLINDFPKSWNLDEIAKATPPFGHDEKVSLLVWKITEEEGSRSQSCIVLRLLDKDDRSGRWCVAHLYWDFSAEKPKWRLSRMHVSGEKGTEDFPGRWILHSKRFKTKPNNKELYDALKSVDIHWNFVIPIEEKFVACGVCEQNWKEFTGEMPTEFFGVESKSYRVNVK